MIPAVVFATCRHVTVARISELERKTTQSGKANSGRWLLEFERDAAMRPDPLTGWAGSRDTKPQVRMNFPTKEAAIAYAKRHGLDFHLVPANPTNLKIQAYSDTFARAIHDASCTSSIADAD